MHTLDWIAQNGPGLFWAVFIFAAMVFIHEFGHFVMAKRVGVKVQEFALGFGQRIFSWKKGETEYAVRLFPLGGYVKMLGEGDEGDPNDPGNFQNKTLGQKVTVVAAGPLMNYVLAILLLIFMGVTFGVNKYVPLINGVLPNMPAAKAGIQTGDEILSINGQRYAQTADAEKVINDMVTKIRGSAGLPLRITVRRGEKTLDFTVTPVPDPKEKIGLIGIRPGLSVMFEKTDIRGAIANSLISTAYFTKAPFVVFGQIFKGKRKLQELASGSAGPIGIGDFIVTSYARYHKTGEAVQHLIWLAALLNIFIGLFNLFPIPALDGSRIFFMLLGGAFGKPLNTKLEEGIHLAGFAFLLLLMVLITYQDIHRIVTHQGF